MWVVVGVESGVGWPTTETRVTFRGRELILRPETENLAATVIMLYEAPETHEQALLLVREFLSSLVWVEGQPIREIMNTGGTHPIGVGKARGIRVTNPAFRADYLPDPQGDSRARLALALYREALSLDSVPYKFLSFFKIVNIIHTGDAQKRWINAVVDRIDNYAAKARAAQLHMSGEDIGNYLYVSGRCAVAHAHEAPSVNPDNPEDEERLMKDMPLIQALAEYLIEHELSVKSLRTMFREHLYELEGFREIFGTEIVNRLKGGDTVAPHELPRLPALAIRVRDSVPLMAFEGMNATVLEARRGRILLRCLSADNRIEAGLVLNFADDRLEFDPVQGVTVQDDGSSRVVEEALDRIEMVRRLIMNGQLEVWDATREHLLSRTDPFIPQNMDFDETLARLERGMEALKRELARRVETR